jgi:crossover junction endodeoxyribonuclease RuvC
VTARILGVDVGLASCGWAVIERAADRWALYAHGCVKTTPADGDDITRAVMIHRALRDVIESHAPRVVVTEAWRYYPDSDTTQAHALGMVIAAVHLAAVVCGVDHAEGARAQDWRRALGLRAEATKAACQQRVAAALGRPAVIAPQHASDAAAVALVYGSAVRMPVAAPQTALAGARAGSDGAKGVPARGRAQSGRGRAGR